MLYHMSEKQLPNDKILKSVQGDNALCFFADCFGSYGLNSLTLGLKEDVSINYFKEIIFEWVRQKEFSDKISRFSCLYGMDDLSQLVYWEDIFPSQTFVYEVSAENSIKLDVGWYDYAGNTFSSIIESARKYWSGSVNEKHHRPEVLIAFPIRIIACVRGVNMDYIKEIKKSVLERILAAEKNCGMNDVTLLDNLSERGYKFNRNTINDWKSGKSSSFMSCLLEIADILGTNVDYLIARNISESPLVFHEPMMYDAHMQGVKVSSEITQTEKDLILDFRKLNEEGQEKTAEYIDDLVTSGKYIKNNSHRMADEKRQV